MAAINIGENACKRHGVMSIEANEEAAIINQWRIGGSVSAASGGAARISGGAWRAGGNVAWQSGISVAAA